jgi:hypothetical protein
MVVAEAEEEATEVALVAEEEEMAPIPNQATTTTLMLQS